VQEAEEVKWHSKRRENYDFLNFLLPNYQANVRILLKINCTVEMTVCCFGCC